MLYRNHTNSKMSSRTSDILADLHNRFGLPKETSPSTKYKFSSPTSTLSSGYQSACSESEIDEMLYSGQSLEESEYFELESDQYVCLSKQPENFHIADEKLQRVRESMIKIISDLGSLGYETSLDKLSSAVNSSISPRSVPKGSANRRECRKSERVYNNNNDVYIKSPVDELFTEIKHDKLDAGSKEKLYDSLISNLAMECASDSSDEPIYEEIHDDSDFDFVSHSDTYRRSSAPPALPPREQFRLQSKRSSYTPTHRRVSSCLTEVQKVTWNSGYRKSSTWQAMSV